MRGKFSRVSRLFVSSTMLFNLFYRKSLPKKNFFYLSLRAFAPIDYCRVYTFSVFLFSFRASQPSITLVNLRKIRKHMSNIRFCLLAFLVPFIIIRFFLLSVHTLVITRKRLAKREKLLCIDSYCQYNEQLSTYTHNIMHSSHSLIIVSFHLKKNLWQFEGDLLREQLWTSTFNVREYTRRKLNNSEIHKGATQTFGDLRKFIKNDSTDSEGRKPITTHILYRSINIPQRSPFRKPTIFSSSHQIKSTRKKFLSQSAITLTPLVKCYLLNVGRHHTTFLHPFTQIDIKKNICLQFIIKKKYIRYLYTRRRKTKFLFVKFYVFLSNTWLVFCMFGVLVSLTFFVFS